MGDHARPLFNQSSLTMKFCCALVASTAYLAVCWECRNLYFGLRMYCLQYTSARVHVTGNGFPLSALPLQSVSCWVFFSG